MLLLLQSSDRVSHDICESLEALRVAESTDQLLVLALRKWHKLNPEREFRCFVKGNKLTGDNEFHFSLFDACIHILAGDESLRMFQIWSSNC